MRIISQHPHPRHADLSALPPNLIQRLQRNGVRSLQDWRDLGAGRNLIFGITRAMAATIDELAKAALS